MTRLHLPPNILEHFNPHPCSAQEQPLNNDIALFKGNVNELHPNQKCWKVWVTLKIIQLHNINILKNNNNKTKQNMKDKVENVQEQEGFTLYSVVCVLRGRFRGYKNNI